MALDDASAIAALRDITAYCQARRDALDPETVEYQRYRIAGISTGKALDCLVGQRDQQIQTDMARSRANLEAFDRWCREVGNSQAVYLPGNDYAQMLRELHQEA